MFEVRFFVVKSHFAKLYCVALSEECPNMTLGGRGVLPRGAVLLREALLRSFLREEP